MKKELVEIFVLGFGKIVGYFEKDDENEFKRLFNSGGKKIKFRNEHIVAETPLKEINLEQHVCCCKNEKMCKGFYWITSKDKNTLTANDVSCPYTKQYDCDYGSIGILSELPYELRTTLLEGMQTCIPKNMRKKLDKEVEETKKNG